jgi:Putative lumazine-binding
MRNTIAALAFCSLMLATLAWARHTSVDETVAITAVAQNYMDAYYTGDVGRMQHALHPEFHKRTLQTVNGKFEIREDSVQSMLEGCRSGTGKNVPPAERVQKIEVLDVYKDAASVKVVTGRWIDYMHLSRVNGEWRVLDVVLQYTHS